MAMEKLWKVVATVLERRATSAHWPAALTCSACELALALVTRRSSVTRVGA